MVLWAQPQLWGNSPWEKISKNHVFPQPWKCTSQEVQKASLLRARRGTQSACVWKPLFGRNGLASPKGDLQICSEDRNSRVWMDSHLLFASLAKIFLDSRVIVHEGLGFGNMSIWLAPYWLQLRYCLSIHTRTKAFLVCFFPNCQGLQQWDLCQR